MAAWLLDAHKDEPIEEASGSARNKRKCEAGHGEQEAEWLGGTVAHGALRHQRSAKEARGEANKAAIGGYGPAGDLRLGNRGSDYRIPTGALLEGRQGPR